MQLGALSMWKSFTWKTAHTQTMEKWEKHEDPTED